MNSGSRDHVEEKEVRGDDASERNSGDVVVMGAPQGTWSDNLRLSTSCCEESSMYFCMASCCRCVSFWVPNYMIGPRVRWH